MTTLQHSKFVRTLSKVAFQIIFYFCNNNFRKLNAYFGFDSALSAVPHAFLKSCTQLWKITEPKPKVAVHVTYMYMCKHHADNGGENCIASNDGSIIQNNYITYNTYGDT